MINFICPRCQTPLKPPSPAGMPRLEAPDQLECGNDALVFRRVDGIWRFLLPERESHFSRFITDYETVRRHEGRFSADDAYYRALPFEDASGGFSSDWKIRAASYRALTKFIPPKSSVADLGAGNGWLSNRLALDGHDACAVDLLVNRDDGLGAWRHYESRFTPVQAEFAALPFPAASMDAIVFNASLHYAESCEQTFAESLRALKPGGLLIVMDSPVYRRPESGRKMLAERRDDFLARYGFASDSIPSEGFLTYERMERLARDLKIHWRHVVPFYGLRWALRPLWARLRGGREPAQFGLWLGSQVKPG